MNKRDEAVYTAARHVGLPGDGVTRFLETLKMCGYELAERTKEGIALPVRTNEPEEGEDVAILDANGEELGADEIVSALNAPPLEYVSESIPIAEIMAQIEHIQENGVNLAKFGGDSLQEGRCRELCAMYLREFIINKRCGDQLRSLDRISVEPQQPKGE